MDNGPRSRIRAKAAERSGSSMTKNAANDANGHGVLGIEWSSGDQHATCPSFETGSCPEYARAMPRCILSADDVRISIRHAGRLGPPELEDLRRIDADRI